MAQFALTATRRWAAAPLALRIALIYLAARAVTTAMMIAAATLSTSLSRFGAEPGLADFIVGWDAQWYWLVAEEGYPSSLPLTESGEVAENAWAFMPVFAFAAKTVGFVFGSWGMGAFLLSFVAGYFACLALHRLLRERIGARATMWSVVFFASGPVAAMFQVGYAETLFLLLLFLALDATVRRNYVWLYLLIPVMAFTRPGILAFALYLGLHGILRWWHRRDDPLALREIVHIVALGALATIAGFSWQVSRASSPETPARTSRPSSPGAGTGSSAASRVSCRSKAGSRRPSSGSPSGGFPARGAPSLWRSSSWRQVRLCSICPRCARSVPISGSGARATFSICSPSSSRSRALSGCSCR